MHPREVKFSISIIPKVNEIEQTIILKEKWRPVKNWTDDGWVGGEMLVELVEESYNFLTGALSNVKMQQMTGAKWKPIALTLNSLIWHVAPFPADKIKKKWFDVKRKIKTWCRCVWKRITESRIGVVQNPLVQPTEFCCSSENCNCQEFSNISVLSSRLNSVDPKLFY